MKPELGKNITRLGLEAERQDILNKKPRIRGKE